MNVILNMKGIIKKKVFIGHFIFYFLIKQLLTFLTKVNILKAMVFAVVMY